MHSFWCIQVTIYDLRSCADREVHDLCCSNSDCSRANTVYDPAVDSIFVFSDNVWLTYAVFASFDADLHNTPSTFTAFVNRHSVVYDRCGQKFVSKTLFIRAWWAWNSALSMDYDALFSCPVCDQLEARERCYIIDGTALGIRWRHLQKRPVYSDSKESAATGGTHRRPGM